MEVVLCISELCDNLFQMTKHFCFPFLSLCVPPSVSPQYKKHRLSLGHTNNYAKSVVNMADMVGILLILFLESLPPELSALWLSTHFSPNQPRIVHFNHFLGHRMQWAAIRLISRGSACWWHNDSVAAELRGTLFKLHMWKWVRVLCCWNLTSCRSSLQDENSCVFGNDLVQVDVEDYGECTLICHLIYWVCDRKRLWDAIPGQSVRELTILCYSVITKPI